MKEQKQLKVLLGLSGGVDSAVAALLLKEQGYKVIAAFMKNFSGTKNILTGECNWVEEQKMAQKVAARLQIPFIVLDFEKQYRKEVVRPMIDAYAKNLTPNADVWCNTIIKFPLLWKHALKLKADYIATGHYARIKKIKQDYSLLEGKDKSKDQSYFLAELNQFDLSHILFPLGNFTKSQVREIAKKHKFPNYSKKSTRGMCFIGKVSMKSFLKSYVKFKSGPVKDTKNNIIGTHEGSQLYTIGERAGSRIGINIASQGEKTARLYILKKEGNTLIIGPSSSSLYKRNSFLIKNLHFINPKDKKSKISCKARIRHLGQLIQCTLNKEKSKYFCKLKVSIPDIAPGQYAVFLQKDKILASGEISNLV